MFSGCTVVGVGLWLTGLFPIARVVVGGVVGVRAYVLDMRGVVRKDRDTLKTNRSGSFRVRPYVYQDGS